MASSFTCRLITPDAKVLEEKAIAAVLPAWDGQLGILPGRAPIVMRLGTGELRIDFANEGSSKGGSRQYLVDQGFANMADGQLTILAEKAVPAEQLSEQECQAELAEAEARRTDGLSASEVEKIRQTRERARHKLRVARSFRERGGGI